MTPLTILALLLQLVAILHLVFFLYCVLLIESARAPQGALFTEERQ